MHRVTRDSFAGAACAGPKAQVRPPATRAKPALDDKSEGEAKTTAIVVVKKGATAPEWRQSPGARGTQQAKVCRRANGQEPAGAATRGADTLSPTHGWRVGMSLSSRFALDRSGDIGWQFLRPSQRMADPRHFQLPRGDLTSGLSMFASCAERTLAADEHTTDYLGYFFEASAAAFSSARAPERIPSIERFPS